MILTRSNFIFQLLLATACTCIHAKSNAFVEPFTASPPLSPPLPFRGDKSKGIMLSGRTQLFKVATSFENVLSSGGQHVDVDELLRACKVFAKIIRDIGHTSAARDMENNICKAEATYRAAPPDQRHSLALLLQLERDSGIHGEGGKLSDPSAAMGLLWLRRSLAFQSEMYRAILKSKDPSDAARDAYRLHLQPFHGWALRQLFSVSFSSMPRRDILAKLGGFQSQKFGDIEERATVEDLKWLVSVWQPILTQWQRTFEELGLEDVRRA